MPFLREGGGCREYWSEAEAEMADYSLENVKEIIRVCRSIFQLLSQLNCVFILYNVGN